MASLTDSPSSSSARFSYSSHFSTTSTSTILSDLNDNDANATNHTSHRHGNSHTVKIPSKDHTNTTTMVSGLHESSNCFYSRSYPFPPSPNILKVDELSKLYHCSILPPQLPCDKGKLTVVLDIDETLVHARLPEDIYRQEEERLDVSDVDYEGDTFEVSLRPGESFIVNKRPGLDEFLREASKRYELIAYTAAVEEYAKPLIDQLDPENRIFRHRLYRSHCIFANGHFVKDLRIVNRPLDRVVLVDNNAYCFLPQLSNGIPISSFYNDHTDTALDVLHKFLRILHSEKEVQSVLKDAFKLEKILAKDRDQLLSGHPHFS